MATVVIILIIIFSIVSGWLFLTKNENGTIGNASSRLLAVDSMNNIHIVWKNHDFNTVNYTKLSANGEFITEKSLILNASSIHNLEALVDSKDNLHLCWDSWNNRIIDDITLLSELHYMKLSNDGDILVNNTEITNNPSSSHDVGIVEVGCKTPSLALDSSDNIHIAWEDWSHGVWDISENWGTWSVDVHYIKINTEGNVITPETSLISETGDYNQSPTIFVDNKNQIYIIWNSEEGGNTGRDRVFLGIFRQKGTDVITNDIIHLFDGEIRNILGKDKFLYVYWEDYEYSNHISQINLNGQIKYTQNTGLGVISINESISIISVEDKLPESIGIRLSKLNLDGDYIFDRAVYNLTENNTLNITPQIIEMECIVDYNNNTHFFFYGNNGNSIGVRHYYLILDEEGNMIGNELEII